MTRWRGTVLGVLVLAVLACAAAAQERGALSLVLKTEDSATAAPAETVEIYARSYALVIGNNAYQGRGWPRLSNAVKDAKEIDAALTRHGFKVTLKLDLASDELTKAFEDFIYGPGADKDARLLIWFAGHGHTLKEEGYLVPVDAPAATGADFFRKALSLRRFGEYLRHAESKHVLAVFDSCFSGSVFDTARAPPPLAITRATTLPVRQMISSGEASQQVSDNGDFRKLFIDALDGKEPTADANRDGFITGTELGLFLEDKVTNLTRNAQTPRYGKLRELGLDRGDFVFRMAPVALPPSPAPPALPKAVAVGPYDGKWTVTRSSSDLCPARTSSFTITILGNVIYAPGGNGTVSSSGDIVIPGQSNTFTGKLQDNAGTGKFTGRCSGTFTARRG